MTDDTSAHNQSPVLLSIGAFVLASVFLVLLVLKLPLRESLWLDETISVWISSGGLTEAFQRSSQYQGQSPLYFVLLSFLPASVLESDVALRLLHLGFFFCGVFLLGVYVARLTGQGVIVGLAALSVCSSDYVLATCLSVRPYAPLFLFLSLSLCALHNFLRSGDRRSLFLGYGSFLVVFYFHYLYLALLFLFLGTAYLRGRLRSAVLSFPFYLLLALMIPGVAQLFSYSERIQEWSGAVLTVEKAVLMSAPWVPVFALLFAVFVLWKAIVAESGKRGASWQKERWAALQSLHQVHFLLLLGFAPLILFVLADLLLGTSLFHPRYFLYGHVALCLLLAALVSFIPTKTLQLSCLAIFSVMLILRESLREWSVENWRQTLSVITEDAGDSNKRSKVLFYSGLFEADELSVSSIDDEKKSYLAAPVKRYAPGLLPQVILIPGKIDSLDRARMQSSITNEKTLWLLSAKVNFPTADGGGNLSVSESYASLLESLGYSEAASPYNEEVAHVRLRKFERIDS